MELGFRRIRWLRCHTHILLTNSATSFSDFEWSARSFLVSTGKVTGVNGGVRGISRDILGLLEGCVFSSVKGIASMPHACLSCSERLTG